MKFRKLLTIALLFVLASPVTFAADEDLVVMPPQYLCLTLLQSGDRCNTYLGQFEWWWLNCDAVVTPTPPPCPS